MATVASIEAALRLINLGLNALTIMQVSQETLQRVSNMIQKATAENRDMTDDELRSLFDEADAAEAELDAALEEPPVGPPAP